MNKLIVLTLTSGLTGWAAIVGAQQTAGGSPAATSGGTLTIDCPPAKAQEAAPGPTGTVGTPSGTGTGSGIMGRPSESKPQRLDGNITQLESTRTERGIHVGATTLWVEPNTVVLVGCENAVVSDLKEGMQVKAAYEVKDGRNVARVIEAENK